MNRLLCIKAEMSTNELNIGVMAILLKEVVESSNGDEQSRSFASLSKWPENGSQTKSEEDNLAQHPSWGRTWKKKVRPPWGSPLASLGAPIPAGPTLYIFSDL